ncbi:MalY/PatB family protein [Parabacteroides chinchillae]|uniref:cysteine-S-conjugate beta-lyase n=1 Tax=Parabacteroides chinchillae TaxID=871327 RepID=A0A8G2BUU1_9BACT|nr:PatB family C-S lyase [Parabacteroides chinchillae]SEF61588.1 cystathione beta-lyase [Parabacteroides chinchillae]
MKQYNFDEVIERRGTNCIKHDLLKERFGDEKLIPLWVADMDFRTPDFIVEAIKKRCEHEVFGYTYGSDEYYESIINWVHYKHNWKIQKEWISYIPGIVKGISFALQCFTRPGDKIIIQPPVYHPFRIVPQSMKREVVYNPLKLVEGSYEMDFEQLESIIDEKCKALILCNPHNPGGIVWKKETLVQLAEVCAKHHILVISDEIHAEMAYPQYKHYPFATVSDNAALCCITFMAPSKTFNIAGIVTSYAIIPNDRLRKEFYEFLEAGEFGDGTIFAYEATTAAYTYGAEWLQQMRMYIMENVRFVDEFIKTNLPKIKMYMPQASFLIWLDCRELKLNQEELVDLFQNKAGLALNDGSIFGPGGEGHMRLNIGCPRSILETSLNALKKALNKEKK